MIISCYKMNEDAIADSILIVLKSDRSIDNSCDLMA